MRCGEIMILFRNIRALCLALLVGSATVAPCRADIEDTLNRWWGDTTRVTKKEQQRIYLRRVLAVTVAAFSLYGFVQGFAALFPIKPCLKDGDGAEQEGYGVQYAVSDAVKKLLPGAQFVYLRSPHGQQGNQCGDNAFCTAKAVQAHKGNLAQVWDGYPGSVKRFADQRKEIEVGEHDMLYDEQIGRTARALRIGTDNVFSIGRYGGPGDGQVVKILPRNEQAAQHIDADAWKRQARTYVRDVAQGRRDSVSFLLNLNNIHWRQLTLLGRQRQSPLAVFTDSANGGMGNSGGLFEQLRLLIW